MSRPALSGNQYAITQNHANMIRKDATYGASCRDRDFTREASCDALFTLQKSLHLA
jgi:hypothetical protein